MSDTESDVLDEITTDQGISCLYLILFFIYYVYESFSFLSFLNYIFSGF